MRTADSRPVDILLVDDNPAKLLALETVLAPLGQNLISVNSGRAALRQLMSRRVATVILDVNMPEMDGFETAQLILARPSSEQTPIIFVTAVNLEREDALRGYALGAVDYIFAPIVPEVLRSKVAVFVDLHRKSEELERLHGEARTLLASIVEFSLDAIITKTLDGRITSWNAGATRLFGYTPDEVIGRPVTMLFPPEIQDQERDILARLSRGEPVEHFETERVAKDGRVINVSLTVSPLRDASGRVVGASKIARDITERKRAEQALRQSEERLTAELAAAKLLQDVSTRLIHEGDAAAMYDQILAAAVGIMGSDMASMQMLDEDRNALRLLASRGFDPASARAFAWVGPETKTACGAACRTGRRVVVPDVETCEFIVETPALEDHRGAGIRAVQSTPLVSRSGRLLGMISTHWRRPHQPAERELRLMDVLARQAADLVARHHAENALRDSEGKFRALADNISQLAWMADGKGRVFWFNRRWFEYTGMTLEASEGWGWTRALHPDHGQPVEDKFRASLESGEPMDDTFPLRGDDGGYRWFLSRAFPIRDESGEVTRWFGTCTDVTEEREAQQILTRDRETLERIVAERTVELDRSKERLRLSEHLASLGTLCAGLGHDMGNLLLPVRFHLESITAQDVPPSVHEDVSAVLRCTEYLQRLVHGLRMLSLDSEADSASRRATDLSRWWADVSPVLRGCLPRGVVLEADPDSVRGIVRIPEHHLSQVVFNLVQNAGDAMRARDAGSVRIWTRRCGDGALQLGVTDDGPGMSDDVKARCFEPFFTTKARGISTGLGLSIVRTLVTKAGGGVSIESRVGEGTTFVLTLLCAGGEGSADGHNGSPARPEALISISEPRIAGYVASLLDSLGHTSRTGLDGILPGTRVWIVESVRAERDAINQFCGEDPARRVVIVGRWPSHEGGSQIMTTGGDVSPATIRQAVRRAVSGAVSATEEIPDASADPSALRR